MPLTRLDGPSPLVSRHLNPHRRRDATQAGNTSGRERPPSSHGSARRSARGGSARGGRRPSDGAQAASGGGGGGGEAGLFDDAMARAMEEEVRPFARCNPLSNSLSNPL